MCNTVLDIGFLTGENHVKFMQKKILKAASIGFAVFVMDIDK